MMSRSGKLLNYLQPCAYIRLHLLADFQKNQGLHHYNQVMVKGPYQCGYNRDISIILICVLIRINIYFYASGQIKKTA